MSHAHRGCVAVALLIAGCGRLGYGPASSLDAESTIDGGAAGRDVGVTPDTAIPDAMLDATGAGDTGPANEDGGPANEDAGPATDDAGLCPEAPCRVVAPQCGCAPGLGCAPDPAGGLSCSMRGAASEGELCDTSADCAPGLNCGKFGGRAPPGTCVPYCGTAADCASGRSCSQMSPPIAGLGLCSALCDAVAQTGCPAGTACFVFPVPSVPDGAVTLGSACSAPTGLAEGATCARPRDCGPGLTCADLGGGLVCAPQCVVGGAACVSGSCAPYSMPVTHLGVEYGVCA